MTRFGCVALDLAAASSLAMRLARSGSSSVLRLGQAATGMVPQADSAMAVLPPDTRSRHVADALAWLHGRGDGGVFLLHGASLDEAERAALVAVSDTLAMSLGCGFAPLCLAEPERDRTVYQGRLFIGRQPAGNDDLTRDLAGRSDGAIGSVPYPVVSAGVEAIRRALTGLKESGRRYALLDALDGEHLRAIAAAVQTQPLVVGGVGLAAELIGGRSREPSAAEARPSPDDAGADAVIVGACTRDALLQVGAARRQVPSFDLDPLSTPGDELATSALDWADRHEAGTGLLIASSATPDRVAALRARLGREAADALVLGSLAAIAEALVVRGRRRLMVFGSETGSAVTERLGARCLYTDARSSPWLRADTARGELRLVLGSGREVMRPS